MATGDMAMLGDVDDKVSALTFDANAAAVGVYKLVQKVITLMFTDSSSPYALGRGTELPEQLVGANALDLETTSNLFNIAVSKVKETLLAIQTSDQPDDELLVDIRVEVLVADLGSDGREVNLTVISAAGEAVTVKVPVTNLTLVRDL
jgi:hypothetical protein